jgi:hypothetical protein
LYPLFMMLPTASPFGEAIDASTMMPLGPRSIDNTGQPDNSNIGVFPSRVEIIALSANNTVIGGFAELPDVVEIGAPLQILGGVRSLAGPNHPRHILGAAL